MQVGVTEEDGGAGAAVANSKGSNCKKKMMISYLSYLAL